MIQQTTVAGIMKDENKTKVQLIKELQQMRKRVAELEQNSMIEDHQKAHDKALQAKFISEKKRTAASLSLSKFCIDRANIGIYQVGMDGRIFNVNPYAARMLGYTTEELTKLSICDIDPFVSLDTMGLDIERLSAGRQKNTFETIHIKKDGTRIPVEITGNILEYKGQWYSIAFVKDITERKRAEDSMRLSRFIIDNANVGIYRIAPNGRIKEVNPKAVQLLGYTKKELESLSMSDIDPQVAREDWNTHWRRLNLQGIQNIERTHLKKDGSVIFVGVHSNLLEYGNRQYAIAFVQDITERKGMEQAVKESKERLDLALDGANQGIWDLNLHEGTAYMDARGYRMAGYEPNEFPGILNEISKRIHENDLEYVRSTFCRYLASDLETYEVKFRFLRKDGTYMWVLSKGKIAARDAQGHPIRFIGINTDITQQKKMEEMLIQSEKMLSVGGLAAGMAHEINNPLAGMLQTAQVMSQRLTAGANLTANKKAAKEAGISIEAIDRFMQARGIPQMLLAITESGQRMADIVSNILSFARKEESDLSSHYLNKILDKTIELAATDYNLKKKYDFKQIKITREYDDNLPDIPCQAGKIQQVILNILTNGAQAMQEAGILEPQFILRTYADPVRNRVCLEIEDNGPGMDEKTRKHIFDPFFTTKPVGVGTGLGLSVSYFIITETHKGEMMVESSPGAGAKFIIQLADSYEL
ncbi:PAS domain S-box protein [uncultured Desulfobacter sp.]|uniref:PAS domain-containing sensor histidine kinase n=1 Tax=uncultured Desulfobacter sp. TaxID=240139 RepID=UPI002AA6A700|nr:PAS domain S-box protein [uncultured Desulfobacter sp.]